MAEVVVNYLAVLLCGILAMGLGMIWYSPAIFGNSWMRLSGKSKEDMKKVAKEGMTWRYVLAFIAALLTAYILSHFIDYLAVTTLGGGLQAGFWLWLGFIAPTMLGMVLWDNKSWKLYWIISGYHLVSLLLQGMIIAVWQ